MHTLFKGVEDFYNGLPLKIKISVSYRKCRVSKLSKEIHKGVPNGFH